MRSTATARFTLEKWEPQSTEELESGQFARVAIEKAFTGEIEGTSTVEMLTAGNDASRAYVAFERFTGSVHGRKGTFVLHHSASDTGMTLGVLTGSGTGELAGISGSAVISQDEAGGHAFKLDYALG